jgi:hypothetical protein
MTVLAERLIACHGPTGRLAPRPTDVPRAAGSVPMRVAGRGLGRNSGQQRGANESHPHWRPARSCLSRCRSIRKAHPRLPGDERSPTCFVVRHYSRGNLPTWPSDVGGEAQRTPAGRHCCPGCACPTPCGPLRRSSLARRRPEIHRQYRCMHPMRSVIRPKPQGGQKSARPASLNRTQRIGNENLGTRGRPVRVGRRVMATHGRSLLARRVR